MSATTEPSFPADRPAKPAAKRRRRWRKVLLVAVLLLAVLVAALPWLASTGIVRSLVLSIANRDIQGKVALDDLSLSWFGPCRLRGLSVQDSEARPVLTGRKIEWSRGLWHAIFSGEDRGRIDVDAAHITLHVAADGAISLARAFGSKQALPAEAPPPKPTTAEPSKPSPLEKLRIAVALNECQVDVVRHDGRRYDVTSINGLFQLGTVDDIQARLAAEFNKAGKIDFQANIRHILSGGSVNLETAEGEVTLKTAPPIELAPLVAVALDGAEGSGNLAVALQAKLGGGSAVCEYIVRAANVSVASSERKAAERITMRLDGDASYKSRQVSGKMKAAGPLGSLDATLQYDTSKPMRLSAGQVMDLLMEGKSVELPECSLSAGGRLDLAAANRSIPGLIKLRKDVEVQAGEVKLEEWKAQGGAAPSAKGGVTVNLTLRRGGAVKQWEPMVGGFEIRTDEQKLLRLERASWKSGFATADASGTMARLTATARADLEALRRHLADVMDIETDMSGSLGATLAIAKDPKDAKQNLLSLDATATSVRIGRQPPLAEPKPAEPPEAVSAKLLWEATLRRDGDRMGLTGKALVPQVTLSRQGELFPQDRIELTHDLLVDSKTRHLEVRDVKLSSKLLSAELAGGVSDLDTNQVLELKGNYRVSWEQLTSVLRRLWPEGAQSMAMVGESAGDIRVSGPARKPELRPQFLKVDGATALGWKTGSRVYGLSLGDAKFEPSLTEAVMKLPTATVTANEGKLRLGCDVDLRGQEPALNIPGKLVVLENVGLNQEVGRDILSRVVPLLAELSKLEGKVNLEVQDVRLPMGDSLKRSGAGSGKLDLSSMRMSPAGEMSRLLEMLGLGGGAYPVKVSGADFQVADGGVKYDNLTLLIGDSLDLRFRGTVRFDDSMDLVVSVPMRAELLQALGVKGLAGQYAKVLEGTRVEIPLAGSRKHPRLDLSRVDVKKLTAEAVKRGAGSVLPDILGPKSGAGGATKPSGSPLDLLPKGLPTSLPGFGG